MRKLPLLYPIQSTRLYVYAGFGFFVVRTLIHFKFFLICFILARRLVCAVNPPCLLIEMGFVQWRNAWGMRFQPFGSPPSDCLLTG